MRSNNKIIIGAIIAAVFLFWGLFNWVNRSNTPPTNTAQNPNTPNGAIKPVSSNSYQGKVAYAAVDIPARSIITRDMLVLKDYSGTDKNLVNNIDAQAIGYVTRVGIPAGSQVRPDSDFVGHISEVGIAGALQPGTRAMVVPIANKPTLHDLVRIGNYVDIISAFDGQESRTIVRRVRVLAVDVFGNDYPQVNVAMRGPYKADSKGIVTAPAPAPGAPGAPGSPDAEATPTPTPAPAAANAPRPDPALTLEVTPEQAVAIQLAQNTGVLDFVVLPSLPGNNTLESSAPDGESTLNPEGTPIAPTIQNVSITKAKLAPYAESRKKPPSANMNLNINAPKGTGNEGGGRIRNTGTGDGIKYQGPSDWNMTAPTPIVPMPVFTPAPIPNNGPAPQQNYQIPIYGDGKVVRTETVPLPSE